MKATFILGLALFGAANAYAQSGAVPEKAKQICAACHGESGNEAKVPGAAKLAGQHPDYLYHALRAYKSGQRKNAIMSGQVQTLSDKEMRQLADYYAAQTGSLKVIR